jgi:hypothetical protein
VVLFWDGEGTFADMMDSLDPGMKANIRNDVDSFFDSRDTYERLKVPWKRGIVS